MAVSTNKKLSALIREHEADLLTQWMSANRRIAANAGLDEDEMQRQAHEFVDSFASGLASDAPGDVQAAPWAALRELLARIASSRAHQGSSPSETATFVFSLKKAIFSAIRGSTTDINEVADLTWSVTLLLDALGLLVTELHQRVREEVIVRQQQEVLELSTPVITLWEGILALPVIGTLDSGRTQVVMENLLQRIVDTGSVIAILDITGVPTVDTLVAQHLLKTVAAARLMGADCIISGIRPQIAQTIVHLGVDLNSVTTKATLADAFAVALRRLGRAVTRTGAPEVSGMSKASPASNGPV
jgi:rsbT co-antagonist protein RsbR